MVTQCGAAGGSGRARSGCSSASEGLKKLSQEQNSCILLPAGTDSPHCESHPVTEVLMLKLPVLLWASKGNTECYFLAFNLSLRLHIPSAKWEFVVELPSL